MGSCTSPGAARRGARHYPIESTESKLKGKIATGDFDVFLCHNSEEKAEIKQIGEQLEALGILPWLDEWKLRPGTKWQRVLEQQIASIESAAIFVGKSGIGPWESEELDALFREFVERHCPVIPVILATCEKTPEIPSS